MLWSQQVGKEEEKTRLHSSFISSPFGPIPTISNKMLSLYYDPSDLSNLVKTKQFPVILGSQTFMQVTKLIHLKMNWLQAQLFQANKL